MPKVAPFCPPKTRAYATPLTDKHQQAEGFPRACRLVKPVQFRTVFSQPCRVNAGLITVLARSNEQHGARLGLAISKKSVKRAVGRNRIKRQIRESFRLHRAMIGDYDLVVMVRPGIERLGLSELRASLDSLWQTLKERCEKS